jgi:hypothetical protein
VAAGNIRVTPDPLRTLDSGGITGNVGFSVISQATGGFQRIKRDATDQGRPATDQPA